MEVGSAAAGGRGGPPPRPPAASPCPRFPTLARTVSAAIREARPDEGDALAAIQRDASLAALAHIFPPDLYPYPIDEIRERWRHALADPAMTVLVAEEDGAAIGVAGYRAEWLDGLYVEPDRWSRGVGQSLHDEVLSRLRDRASKRCHLWVLEHNDRARRFYERAGWRENGETRIVPFPPNPIDVGYSIDLS
jgi:GNAT superfamily N-acetyltransferase